jgi:hypothetical protein
MSADGAIVMLITRLVGDTDGDRCVIFVAAIPFLFRPHRRFRTWIAPATALRAVELGVTNILMPRSLPQ